MKAFLSYCHKDGKLVDSVAKHLGRQYCVYDKYAFQTGEEFKFSIQQSLDNKDTGVFVLFASKAALESIWVKFEIGEAWHRIIRERISTALVYIIDNEVSVEKDIPDWLLRGLIRRNNTAQSIARDIRSHLDDMLRNRRNPYFVGRGSDIDRLEELLTPADGSPAPRVFFISGLPGIGRRSLIKNAAPNILNLRKHIEFRIDEGDSINDICAKIADRAESYSNSEDFRNIFEEIQALCANRALERILVNLRTLVASGELPIFLDDGGLLDSEGYIRQPISDLVNVIQPDDSIYISFVSYRKPQFQHNVICPVCRINPLGSAETRRLLQRLSTNEDIDIPPDALRDISEYVAGYPPSAYYAVNQVKEYGLDLLLNHKQKLVEFRTSVFIKHMNSLDLETNDGISLQLLTMFSPLPFQVIQLCLQADIEDVYKLMMKLIDLSLVIADGNGLYRISDPIVDSAINAFGLPAQKRSAIVAEHLNYYIENETLQSRHLELSQALFRAARLSMNAELAGNAIHLVSDIIRLTEKYYHAREYDQAIKCGRSALSERPDSITARSYLIRSLIQKEQWIEADRELTQLTRFAPARDVYFLHGFMKRRQGYFLEAITAYEDAKRAGRKGASINRELSQCYFLSGDLEKANYYLNEALIRHGDNRYVVDLWAQIATRRGDEESARKALARLEVIDRPIYYYYRKSRIELRFGNFQKAQSAASKALIEDSRPPFAVVAQAALCEMEVGNVHEASDILGRLDTAYGDIRRDIRTGLRCRLELVQNNYQAALYLSERIQDKQTYFYKSIRYRALLNLARSGIVESEYQEEYDLLKEEFGDDAIFDIAELDRYLA